MVFSTTEFLFLFFPIFFLFYFMIPSRIYKNLFLLATSLFFYAWGEHLYVFLMIFFIGFNYLCALAIDKKKSPRAVLIFAVVVNLGLIGYFKYADFFIQTVNSLLGTQIPALRIPLPLGISFFTFQTMSYVIDVYRGDVEVQKNPLWLGEYVACFPQLIAGPIVRYQTVAREIDRRHVTAEDFSDGLRRFILGLGKKAIVANHVAVVCDAIFNGGDPARYGFLGAWIAIISYTLQIYFDFSGYSDMAIGMGRMMGFHFLENFDHPYIARSITEFWRRWHISLSTFFRDYVYIPLGGNRVKPLRWAINLMIVWLLTGLWHGASVNFVIWGLYYGVLLLLEKLFLGKYIEKSGRVLPHVYTMLIVIVGWVVFRLETLPEALEVLRSMLFLNGPGSVSFLVSTQVLQTKYILVTLAAIFLCAPSASRWLRGLYASLPGRIAADVITLGILVLSTVSLIVSNYNPFIYFRF